MELCKIKGVPEAIQRSMGINMSAAVTNAVEISTCLYGLPSMEDLLNSFKNHYEAPFISNNN